MREMAGRKLGNEIYASYIAAVAPGSPTDVIDGQNSGDVPTASVERIRALYGRLYRPQNMMIVIVGNVDPTTVKALITQRFGSWKNTGSPVVHVPVPRLRYDRIAPISFSVLPQGRRTALITVAMPTLSLRGSKRLQTDAELMDMLAIRAVNNRLGQAEPGSPSGKVGMFIENGEQGYRLIMLWDNFAGDAWQPALADLKRTTCGLGTAGFSEGEWDTAGRDLIQDLERGTRGMGHAKNAELAKDLSHAVAADRELIAPSALLERARIWLPTIDASTGNAWWHQQWVSGAEHVRVEAPELAKAADPVKAIPAGLDATSSRVSCDPL
jgi:zinc protease